MKNNPFTEQEQAMFNSLRQPLSVYRQEGDRFVLFAVSDGFCEMFGYVNREQALEDMLVNPYAHIHPDDLKRIMEGIEGLKKKGSGSMDLICRSGKGIAEGYRVIHTHSEYVQADSGNMIQVCYMDEGVYTDQGEADSRVNPVLYNALHENSILRAVHYDELTGLPNLTYFFKLAEKAKASFFKKQLDIVLLYMDMNGMKYFNHLYGFAEGDKLLLAFTELLTKEFGKDHCCHIGGDRFAAISRSKDLQDRLNRLLEAAKKINGGKTLPVQIGIYSTDLGDVPVTTAYDRAKLACEELRKTTKSGFNWYRHELSEMPRRQQYILANLDRAIKEKWIQVYYQPIVRAVNGKVCDEEALARWIDPTEGFLSPAEFIPQLEAAGLIYKLDLYVLEQVLEKILQLDAGGFHIMPHSINLSRSDFEACDIVEEIRQRVDAAGVARDRITIEITESVVGSDEVFIKTQVERFRALGFPVWLDDFGSGYSSMDVLQTIPFKLIKFDMSLMRQLDKGDSGKIILTEMIKMATSLGLDTVCEGVETEEQVRFLQEIGCNKLQGFYFCKPIPYEQIIERYRKGIQIGYEDPETSTYYEAIGRVNLYDLGVISGREEDSLQKVYDTLPMGIIEVRGDEACFVRSNPSYRAFIRRFFKVDMAETERRFVKFEAPFMTHIKQTCCDQGNRAFFDEKMPDGSTVHSFARRISTNPVTGGVALAVAVLSVSDPDDDSQQKMMEEFENVQRERDAIARVMAMTEDYLSLYTVRPETGKYTEYTASDDYRTLGFEKKGEDFFLQGREDGKKTVYAEDLPEYLRLFTKGNVLREIRDNGIFKIHYRLVIQGVPRRVTLKIVPCNDGKETILLAGVRAWRERRNKA